MSEKIYGQDLYSWTRAQAQALRAKDWSLLDLDHLVEEIESLGNEQEHAVESHLEILAMHLLKMAYQYQHRLSSARSIDNARTEIERRLRRSPSLRSKLPQLLEWAYPNARRGAARESRLPRDTFPATCPWSLEQLLDEDFYPEV